MKRVMFGLCLTIFASANATWQRFSLVDVIDNPQKVEWYCKKQPEEFFGGLNRNITKLNGHSINMFFEVFQKINLNQSYAKKAKSIIESYIDLPTDNKVKEFTTSNGTLLKLTAPDTFLNPYFFDIPFVKNIIDVRLFEKLLFWGACRDHTEDANEICWSLLDYTSEPGTDISFGVDWQTIFLAVMQLKRYKINEMIYEKFGERIDLEKIREVAGIGDTKDLASLFISFVKSKCLKLSEGMLKKFPDILYQLSTEEIAQVLLYSSRDGNKSIADNMVSHINTVYTSDKESADKIVVACKNLKIKKEVLEKLGLYRELPYSPPL